MFYGFAFRIVGAISPSGCAGARALAQGIQRFALSLESPQGSAVTSVEVLRTALSKFVPVEIRNAKVAVWLHPMPYCAQGITHQYETVADLLDLGIMLAVAKLHTVLKTDTRDILQSVSFTNCMRHAGSTDSYGLSFDTRWRPTNRLFRPELKSPCACIQASEAYSQQMCLEFVPQATRT